MEFTNGLRKAGTSARGWVTVDGPKAWVTIRQSMAWAGDCAIGERSAPARSGGACHPYTASQTPALAKTAHTTKAVETAHHDTAASGSFRGGGDAIAMGLLMMRVVVDFSESLA